MSVTTYANSSSNINGLLVYLVFLFYISGCAESSSGPDDYGTGIDGRDNNDVIAGTVIEIGDEWKYRKGTSLPPSDWISAGFDDTAWLAGNTGIGYGDDDDATILSDMRGNYSTVYTRKIINNDGSVNINSMALEIDYDDGFVAFINGQEVARANMPAGQPSFDTLASSSREPGTAAAFNLDGFISLIGIGDNVLAIEIHNASLTDNDLSLLPRLLVNMGSSPPPTVSLSANPTSVVLNGSTTLSWNSTDATGCTASGDWSGSKATSGSQAINALSANGNFNLSCSGPGGSASDSVSVTVAAPSTPLVNLSASPTSLPFNGATTLSWSSNNTTACTASGDWSGSKATSGSQTISSLISNSSYNLTCSGAGGSASDSVSVTVAAPSTPSVNLSVSPSNLPYNGATTLSWSSSNTNGCTASGDWSGSKATSGSQTISTLTANSSFNLFCSGPGGSANDTASVTVATPSPTLTFSASPTTVAINGSTTLYWTSTNTTSCTASGDWSGSKASSGSQTINALTTNSIFNLSCIDTGTGASVNDSVSVIVSLSPYLYFEDFSTGYNPLQTNIYGDSIGSLAYSVSESGGWGSPRSIRIDVLGDFNYFNSSAAEIAFENASFFVGDEVHFSWMMWGGNTFWSNFAHESKWMGVNPNSGDPRQISFTKQFTAGPCQGYMLPGASRGGGTSFFHDEFYPADLEPQDSNWYHWSQNTCNHNIQLNDSIANQWVYFEYRAQSGGINRLRIWLRDGTMTEALYINSAGFIENEMYALRWMQQFDNFSKLNNVDSNSYGYLDYIRVATYEMGPPVGFLTQ